VELDVFVIELEQRVSVPFLDCVDDGQGDFCVAHEELRSLWMLSDPARAIIEEWF